MLPPNPKKNLFCKIKSNNLFAKLYVHGIITKTNFCTFILDSHGHCKTERICCFQNFYKKWRTLISSRPLSYQSSTLELTIEWEKINYLMIYEGWLLVCPPPRQQLTNCLYTVYTHVFSYPDHAARHEKIKISFSFKMKSCRTVLYHKIFFCVETLKKLNYLQCLHTTQTLFSIFCRFSS